MAFAVRWNRRHDTDLTAIMQGRWMSAARKLRHRDLLKAALGQAILASRFRNARRLLLISPELLRANPEAHREYALALFHTVGPQAAVPELTMLREHSDIRNLLLAARLAAPTSVRSGSVTLRDSSPAALPVVDIRVNELPPAAFIVDTGAANTLLSRRFASANQLPVTDGEPDPVPLRNRPPFALCRVASLALGGIRIASALLNVAELPPQIEAAGLFSPFSAFREYWWELDFPRNTLHLLRTGEQSRIPYRQWDRTSLYHDGGNVFVNAWLNGRHCGMFLLDTGAGANIITPEFAQAAGIPLAKWDIRTVDIQGSAQVGDAGVQVLTVGNPDASDEPPSRIYISPYALDSRDLAPIQCAGFVGMPWFRRRRILIPPDQKHMYFTQEPEAIPAG